MTKLLIAALIGLGALASAALAQTPAKPAAKAPAKSAAKAAPAPVALSEEQLSIAQIVHTGRIVCADGASVTITADAKQPGAFDLAFGKVKYDVVPVPAKSGAVRLEDPKSGIVYMQLANKSMLFNEKQSKRLADDCISPAQQAVADAMKANPTPSVLDGTATVAK
jgi:hypothetical protein